MIELKFVCGIPGVTDLIFIDGGWIIHQLSYDHMIAKGIKLGIGNGIHSIYLCNQNT